MKTKKFPLDLERRGDQLAHSDRFQLSVGEKQGLRETWKSVNPGSPWAALAAKFKNRRGGIGTEVRGGSLSCLQAEGKKPTHREELRFGSEG